MGASGVRHISICLSLLFKIKSSYWLCVSTFKISCACLQMIKKKKRYTVLLVCHVVSAQVQTQNTTSWKSCVDRTFLYVGVSILCMYQRIFFCGLLCILGTIVLSCAVKTCFCELNYTSLTQVRQINLHFLIFRVFLRILIKYICISLFFVFFSGS